MSKTMFDDLIEVLSGIKEKRRLHESILMANETLTCRALIDPLLTVLGWDTSNPALVVPEYKIRNTFVDYALIGQDNEKPLAVIEAKKLGAPLESKEIDQMVAYANTAGVRYAGLTDGDRWHLYEVFRPVPLSDRCVLDISIAGDPEHQCVLKLLLLWHPNLASGEPIEANSPSLSNSNEGVLHPRVAPSPLDDSKNIPRQDANEEIGDPRSGMPLLEFAVSNGDKPPKTLQFPDGGETPIRKWADILPSVSEWLLKKDLLREIPFPKIRGRKRYILNEIPIHPSGKEFFARRAVRINGRVLYVECQNSATWTIALTKFLLQCHNVDPMKVLIYRQ